MQAQYILENWAQDGQYKTYGYGNDNQHWGINDTKNATSSSDNLHNYR